MHESSRWELVSRESLGKDIHVTAEVPSRLRGSKKYKK